MIQTATDEQDLARALDSVANVASGTNTPAPSTQDGPDIDLKFETRADGSAATTPYTTTPYSSQSSLSNSGEPPAIPMPEPLPDPVMPMPSPTPFPPVPPSQSSQNDTADPASTNPLANIKKDAIVELRPLVDKLSLSPGEKFDTLLLLIRSTDDTGLIAPAHEAAKAIEDETRRAEALLDIIKEIDYLSNPKVA